MTQEDQHLTEEEIRAIKSLERLAKKWPQSLLLFGCNGISIRKNGSGLQHEVAFVSGIPADGGDGGDKF